jgi:hypothetical protein
MGHSRATDPRRRTGTGGPRSRSTTDRGQTTLDFAVGISIFLITVAFTLTFIPGMLDPFTGGLEEETVAVNRVADSLAQGMLGDPADPYVLNRTCTIAFLNESNNDGSGSFNGPPGCAYEETDVLTERLGIQGRDGAALNVRIRLVRDLADDGDDTADILCHDDEKEFIESGAGLDNGGSPNSDCDVILVAGGTPPNDRGSVVVAQRVVTIEGGLADGTSEATLIVEMW